MYLFLKESRFQTTSPSPVASPPTTTLPADGHQRCRYEFRTTKAFHATTDQKPDHGRSGVLEFKWCPTGPTDRPLVGGHQQPTFIKGLLSYPKKGHKELPGILGFLLLQDVL